MEVLTLKITSCKTNHLNNPLGYFMNKPVFSYIVEESKGTQQTEARIRVSDSPDFSSLLFDSGFRKDISPVAFEADMELHYRTKYYWDVTVCTNAGERVSSNINWFETGKMEESWSAKWITCNSEQTRHPIFYKDLLIAKKVKNARLYICGLGLYEAYLNGKKIGQELMTPHCNDYNTWLQYQTYDITEMLQKESRLEVLLGNGWYKGRFGFSKDLNQKPFFSDTWKLIAELHIIYEDHSEEIIGTDEQWNVRRSKITFSNIYDGEIEDSTLEELPEESAILYNEKLAPLKERLSIPVQVQEKLPVKEVLYTPAGETVLDIGQNMAGTFRLNVHEEKGTKIHLQFGEILQNKNFYRDNLRTAKAEYIWISDGKPHTLQPHFTFYGYQYVKIEGVTNLNKDDFSALAIYSDLPQIGHVNTANKLINQLIQNTIWSQKGNFLDVPTDCPQRDERMGWTGDAQVFCPTASYLTDCFAFYRKYLYDMVQEQKEQDGMVPIIIPSVGNKGCSSVWGDAICIIPWNLYLFSGDSSILREYYESMKAWLEYIKRVDGKNHGWRRIFHYGDWLALDGPDGPDGTKGGTDEGFIADVYYRNSALIVSKVAHILQKEDESIYYENLAEKILHGIKDEYFSKTGRCCIDTQTAYILILKYDISEYPQRALEGLKQQLEYSKGKLKTGFVGTPLLCNVLSENGMVDQAYDLLLDENYPGWLYEIKMGATTIWERWNSVLPDGSITPTEMNSLNHYSYGAIVEWIWRCSVGINPIEGTPGFCNIHLRPMPHWGLKYMKAEYASAAGTWKVEWNIVDEKHLKLHFVVPFGCTAEIELPMAPENVYKDNSNPLFKNVKDNICFVGTGDYAVTYETTQYLKEIFDTNTPLKILFEKPALRDILFEDSPMLARIPVSMQDLSMRQLLGRMASGDEKYIEKLDELDFALRAIQV